MIFHLLSDRVEQALAALRVLGEKLVKLAALEFEHNRHFRRHYGSCAHLGRARLQSIDAKKGARS